jgi:hypothetical protein
MGTHAELIKCEQASSKNVHLNCQFNLVLLEWTPFGLVIFETLGDVLCDVVRF